MHRLFGLERDLAVGLWRDALDATFTGAPVWAHGDTAIANLLVQRTPQLAAVIDFRCSAVGDPACDTVIRWTQFGGAARHAYARELRVDDATWARGRGWALWKALITITNKPPGQAKSPTMYSTSCSPKPEPGLRSRRAAMPGGGRGLAQERL